MAETRLIRYDAARHALKVANQVDDAKDIRDKALALAAYARQAKDEEMIRWATEIKLRAERRVGEILAETERAKGGKPVKAEFLPASEADSPMTETRNGPLQVTPKTLEEVGLTRKQSSDFQAMAAVPEAKFEKELVTGKATTTSLAKKGRKKSAATTKPKAEPKPRKPRPPRPKLSDMVSKDDYNKLVDEMNTLGVRCNEQAAMLQTYEDVRNDKAAATITALKAELVNCRRRRDELMNKSAGDEKVILSLQRKLKKYEAAK